MWALKTGKTASQDIKKKVVYTILAVECNLAPEVVDRTDATVVQAIVAYIIKRNKEREKEQKRAESKMRRRGRR